jgi:hypothetical protein
MRNALLLLAPALAAATLAAGAQANGSPYSPGLMYGWPGVAANDDRTHLVAFGMPKSTIVAVVRARDGGVVHSNVVKGFYGVPLVSYDGTPGGLSGDGRSLVLSSYGPNPGTGGRTRFVVLNAKTLELRRGIALRGSWSYDAVSPDAGTLFLVQHIAAGANPRYRVRALDLSSGRLFPKAIVDTRENEALMRGQPVTRVSSGNGRWAYTLYARPSSEPFVHALDTERRQAYCVDLPLELGQQGQMGLRLRLAEGGKRLEVSTGSALLADVDTRTFEVRTGG